MSKEKKKKILKTLFVISLVPKAFTIRALAAHYMSNRIDKDVNFAYQLIETSCTDMNEVNKYVSGYTYKDKKLYPIYSNIES